MSGLISVRWKWSALAARSKWGQRFRAAAALLGGTLLLLPCAFSQSPASRTVLDGVYAEAQARRGEAQYQDNCAGCHGETLDGRTMGALRGEKFLDRWREDNLDVLFDHIKTRMPARAPGSLSESAYLDILAFLLEANELPAGPKELIANDLAGTRLVGKNGPKPLATNALVAVIGCFAPGPNQTWVLANSSEPARTRNATETTAVELKSAADKPLGSQSFRLQNLDELPTFNAGTYQGHKVQVKGVLIRGSMDRINVLSLGIAAAVCDK
jgi:mono/diheme cytochrome c family protein